MSPCSMFCTKKRYSPAGRKSQGHRWQYEPMWTWLEILQMWTLWENRFSMKEYATKLTLYDFISMLMPGSIIVAVLMLLCTDGQLTLPNNAFFWVFFFISSYLAGIVNHIVTSSLYKFFNFRRQQKIHDRVWEDYYYLSRINKEELTKKNPEKQ